MERAILCGLTPDEIMKFSGTAGCSTEHSFQIATNVYKKMISDFATMPKVPKKLKEYLEKNASTGIVNPVESHSSSDGTIKYLFRTDDLKEFETVFIPDGKRNTVCVSTQSGCRMGCRFCATATYGFAGNLTAAEIVNQVLSLPIAKKVNHIVFMGMGEPMDNLDNVLRACEIFTAEWGLSLSPHNITVSTVGITTGIIKFLESSSCNLTVSLHSPFSEERITVVPAEKKYPVQEIITILRNFPLKKNRRVSLAYIMIKDMNDTESHLKALIQKLKGSHVRVNLLPYNNVPDDNCTSSTDNRMQYFKHNLVISGISASVRKSRGKDIYAACGLLASGLKLKNQIYS